MHYQLYFPGESKGGNELLKTAGLADFVAGAEFTFDRVGPDGPGLFVSWRKPNDPAGHLPERQAWEKVDGQPYWLGWWTDSPCVPADLARPMLFAGYDIVLGDKQTWRIPVAADLPRDFQFFGGRCHRVLKAQFAEFWQQSEKWYRRFMLHDLDEDQLRSEMGLNIEQLDLEWWDYCVFVLRQNYRVTNEAVSKLRLIDSNTRGLITTLSIEGMQIQEVLDELNSKKKQPAPPLVETSSVAGEPTAESSSGVV